MTTASDELVKEALNLSQSEDDELDKSEKIAETLNALQGVIERNAKELLEIEKTLKEKREMLKSLIENHQEISEVESKVKLITDELKQKKAKFTTDPAMVNLKLQLAEINQNKKEIEETLSHHLVNYHQLTGSTSFDTTDGDQWEFNIKAKVKNRKN